MLRKQIEGLGGNQRIWGVEVLERVNYFTFDRSLWSEQGMLLLWKNGVPGDKL